MNFSRFMSKSKLTLLVDGNWLLMSRLSVLNSQYMDDFELCQDLKQLMIRSINVVLRTFPLIDNIIFCADGGTWRTQVELPNYLKKEETTGIIVDYKGTRTKSEDINWEMIFSSYEDLITKLKYNGITISKEKDVEGDDWIYYWSNHLNEEGTNCIIWSKDNDLKQLIKIDSNKCFTVWWNKDSGLFTNKKADDNDENFNFMFNYEFDQNEQLFNHIVDKSSKYNYINPKTIVIDKILKGDTSDNLFPIILRVAKKQKEGVKNKVFKISNKDINYDLDYNDANKVKEYIHNLINSKNYVDRLKDNKSEQDIIEHFNYNKKLIVLEKNNYPKNILDIFNNQQEYNIPININENISEVINQINAESNKLNSVLNII